MMSMDKALRLQAWVDGELGASECREVEAWLERDEDARLMVEDLRRLQGFVGVGEVAREVPETRDFYWSGIARGIDGVERASRREVRGMAWWRRWLVPVGALAAVMISLPFFRQGPDPAAGASFIGPELEKPLAGVDAFTFRSESERMTVVWIDFTTN
jgi:anti-sigma factor RsiW